MQEPPGELVTTENINLCQKTSEITYLWACDKVIFEPELGWSGGAKVLGKLPVPGRPTDLDYSRAMAYCACGRCGWGLFGHFSLIYHFSFLSPSLWETARYRLKYCLKGPLSPNQQPTNQPIEPEFQYIVWA